MHHVIIAGEEIISKFQMYLEPADDNEIAIITDTLGKMVSTDAKQMNRSGFLVDGAVVYINENCSEKLTLTEVAKKLYISPFYLSKILNQNVGKSFTEILNEARVYRAKQLLKNPAFRVCDVSEMVGFCDASHFSRVFKKMEGVSANEYRKKLVPEYSEGYVWKLKKVLDF